MTVPTNERIESLSRLRAEEEREFRVLIMVSFAIFLVIAVVSRLLPPRWRVFAPAAEGRRSVFQEARTAAYTTIPFAFML